VTIVPNYLVDWDRPSHRQQQQGNCTCIAQSGDHHGWEGGVDLIGKPAGHELRRKAYSINDNCSISVGLAQQSMALQLSAKQSVVHL